MNNFQRPQKYFNYKDNSRNKETERNLIYLLKNSQYIFLLLPVSSCLIQIPLPKAIGQFLPGQQCEVVAV